MELKVQVIIESDGGHTTVQEVACVERGAQRLAQLGLSLKEGNTLLLEIQRAMVQEQVQHYAVTHRHCADCGTLRGLKGTHAIVYRTVFGMLRVSSPRLYACRCRKRATKSTSSLAELITERTTPELVYLQNRFAAVMSFEAAETLLQEVLPLSGTVRVAGIHRTVQKVAKRLERELGQSDRSLLRGANGIGTSYRRPGRHSRSVWTAGTCMPSSSGRATRGGSKSLSVRVSPMTATESVSPTCRHTTQGRSGGYSSF